MQRLFSAFTLTVCLLAAHAQTDVDALRYSMLTPSGTSRGVGLNNAMGALGADFSALTINPAGLAVYRNSEFMLTPSIVSMRSNTDYLDNATSSFKYNFNFSNAGFVGAVVNGDGKEKDEWVTTNFAFGFNRMASFHHKTFMEGFNTRSSMIDGFLETIQEGGLMPETIENNYLFDLNLAWRTFLIDTIQDSTGFEYFSAIPNGRILQSKYITGRGAINEYFIAFAGNYGNKLYIGGSVGFPHLRYTEESNYVETDVEDTIAGFNSFNMQNNFTTQGMGINLKLGMIYRLNPYLRLGASVHSPTYFSLSDDYYTTMHSDFDNINFDYESPQGEYNYALITPWRVTASAAFIFKKYGFISADYEFVDYSYAFFDSEAGSVSDGAGNSSVNQNIQGKYQPASNIRIGAEGRIDIFRVRGGFGYYGTPFQSNVAEPGGDNSRQSLSFGFGVREDGYYIDFGYNHLINQEAHFPYTLANNDNFSAAITKQKQNSFLVTVGFNF